MTEDAADDASWHAVAGPYRARAESYVRAASGTEPESDWQPPRAFVTLMPSELLEIPLWDEEGVLTTDPVYLTSVLKLSEGLVLDLVEWGMAYEAKPHEISWSAYVSRGHRLAARLRAEIGVAVPVRTGSFS